MVKVSIVLPTYNQSKYLPEAIKTILNQTYQDFELIIVNDGSTDETTPMLANFHHPKVKVINQENKKLPGALNTGFAHASGEYWTWSSTDNVVAPTWLEELVKALDHSPADVGYAFSHYAVIDENNTILYVNRDQRLDIPTLLTRHSGNASFLYRASLAKKVGEYDPSLVYAEDLDMWVRMAELTRAVHVESVLYYYRQHSQSMTMQQDKVRNATKGVVTKFLAKTAGKFNIDQLYPSIAYSTNPPLERWKARIRLVTQGANATFYCPVDTLVDQVNQALVENYERGLIADIVHLYVKENRWDDAAKVVAIYQTQDKSDFLVALANIVARQSKEELQKIPFLMLEEKFIATDCQCNLSSHHLLRNLAPQSIPSKHDAISSHAVDNSQQTQELLPFDKIATDLVNILEDMQDHPDVWDNIAILKTPKEKKNLHDLRVYLTQLTAIPQNPKALLLLQILEAVCIAYTGNLELAKNKLESLISTHPDLPVLNGALHYITHDELLTTSLALGV